VKLILDTHTALWWLTGDRAMSDGAAASIVDPSNTVALSAAVVWEIAIKAALGKLEVPAGAHEALLSAGARPLPITHEHADGVRSLPHHHRDPFDRLLVAQAKIEQAAIVTSDRQFAAYGVPVLW
jgi:PIN domain nuclease of toxin-antitoxin system